MMKLGVNIQITPLPGEQSYLTMTLDQNDLAMIISYRGFSNIVDGIKKILNAKKIPYILVSARHDEHANVMIDLPKTESISRKVSTLAARTSIQYTLNLLYLTYFNSDYDRNLAKRLEAESKIEATRHR